MAKINVGDWVWIKSYDEIIKLYPTLKGIKDDEYGWWDQCEQKVQISYVEKDSCIHSRGYYPFATVGENDTQPGWNRNEFYTLMEKLELLG